MWNSQGITINTGLVSHLRGQPDLVKNKTIQSAVQRWLSSHCVSTNTPQELLGAQDGSKTDGRCTVIPEGTAVGLFAESLRACVIPLHTRPSAKWVGVLTKLLIFGNFCRLWYYCCAAPSVSIIWVTGSKLTAALHRAEHTNFRFILLIERAAEWQGAIQSSEVSREKAAWRCLDWKTSLSAYRGNGGEQGEMCVRERKGWTAGLNNWITKFMCVYGCRWSLSNSNFPTVGWIKNVSYERSRLIYHIVLQRDVQRLMAVLCRCCAVLGLFTDSMDTDQMLKSHWKRWGSAADSSCKPSEAQRWRIFKNPKFSEFFLRLFHIFQPHLKNSSTKFWMF